MESTVPWSALTAPIERKSKPGHRDLVSKDNLTDLAGFAIEFDGPDRSAETPAQFSDRLKMAGGVKEILRRSLQHSQQPLLQEFDFHFSRVSEFPHQFVDAGPASRRVAEPRAVEVRAFGICKASAHISRSERLAGSVFPAKSFVFRIRKGTSHTTIIKASLDFALVASHGSANYNQQ
jgi:hypothetical protein